LSDLLKRLRRQLLAYHNQSLTATELQQSLNSWFAHLSHANTWQFRHQILQVLQAQGIDPQFFPNIP
jgi:hypothetical protein